MTNFIKQAMEERYGGTPLSPQAMMQQVEAARSRQVKRRRIWMTGLCGLVLAASLGGFTAFQIEAAEYREASGYLEKYGIDVESMSRGVVKQVYKDIVTSTFALDSTRSILQELSVQMDIVLPEQPDETQLQAFWDQYQTLVEKRRIPEPTRLEVEDTGLSGRIFTRYVDGEKVWEYHDTERFFDARLNSYNVYAEELSSGTLLHTDLFYSVASSSDYQHEIRLMLIDEAGHPVWKQTIAFAEMDPYIHAVFERDGRVDLIGLTMYRPEKAVDSYRDEYFLVSLDMETGELIQDKRTPLEEFVSIYNVVDLGSQYLLITNKQMVTLSYDGEMGQFTQFDSDGNSYQVQDVLSVGDKYYVSAESENIDFQALSQVIAEYEQMYDLYNFRSFDDSMQPEELTAQQEAGLKEITRLIKEQKNAVLLVLDGNFAVERVVETPYSAAGRLKEEDGKILQEISQIETITDIPVSSFYPTYIVDRMVYQYTFDLEGNLLEQEAVALQNEWW